MAAVADNPGPDYEKLCGFFFITLVAAALTLGFTFMIYNGIYGPNTALYSVAIDSASGLDARGQDLALEPQFNLTLRVTSESLGVGGCVEAKTKKSREVPFVARGSGVRLPGYVMDNLVVDMRNGVHAFEVTVRWSDSYFDNLMLASCGGRQVGGDAAAALGTRCHASHLCPDRDWRRNFAQSSPKHISSLSMVM